MIVMRARIGRRFRRHRASFALMTMMPAATKQHV